MTEFELKLEIPPERLPGVLAALREGKARGKRLQARYFDTQDDALARAAIAVRLRKEGRTWVQTAKCAGEGLLARFEHNVALGALRGAAMPDVSLLRHAETPVGERIRRALDVESLHQAPALSARFEIDVRRLTREMTCGGSRIEVALDRGKVVASGREASLCEIEFELLQGEPAHAVRLAHEWLATHGLWLNIVSKAARGHRLAEGRAFGDPVQAATPGLRRHASGSEILRAVLRVCLEQILGNASDVAAGSTDAEHIHQLRVGIRRLRTALRELQALAPSVDPAWEQPLVDVFRTLGLDRDRSHLENSVQPQLEAHGAPHVTMERSPNPPDPPAAVRSVAFQCVLLELLEFIHPAQGEEGKALDGAKASKVLVARLKKLHAQLSKDGSRFQDLEPPRQHRVRKRLKRLRYLAEFVTPLFHESLARDFIDALKPAQDALGVYNDELMALEAYRGLTAQDPAAWFGVGWLTARREPNAARCQRELERFAQARRFWG